MLQDADISDSEESDEHGEGNVSPKNNKEPKSNKGNSHDDNPLAIILSPVKFPYHLGTQTQMSDDEGPSDDIRNEERPRGQSAYLANLLPLMLMTDNAFINANFQ